MSSAVDSPLLGGWKLALIVLVAVAIAVTTLTFEHFLPAKYIRLAAIGAIACVAGLLVFSFPKYGLLLGIFYIYAGLTFYLKVNAGQPMMVLVMAASAIKVMQGEKMEYPPAAFNWVAAVFFVITIQSLIFAWDLHWAMKEILKLVRSLLMVFIIVHIIRTPRDLHLYVMTIFFAVLTLVVLGFANVMLGLTQVRAMDASGFVRFSSTYADPNRVALFMAAALPLGIYAIRTSRRALVRILLSATMVVFVVVALSTFSRAAILPLAVVVVGVLAREGRNKYVLAAVLLAAFVVFLLTPLKYWDRLVSLGELGSSAIMDKSLRYRMDALQSAWKLFLQNPLTGVGVNNFIVRSPDLVGRRVVHNTYAEVLVGVGIIGFGAYMTMLLLTVREFLRAMRAKWSAQDEHMSHLAFYAMLSFLAVLFGAIFLSMAHSYDIWLPAAGGLAAGCIARRYAATSPTQSDSSSPGGAEVE